MVNVTSPVSGKQLTGTWFVYKATEVHINGYSVDRERPTPRNVVTVWCYGHPFSAKAAVLKRYVLKVSRTTFGGATEDGKLNVFRS